MAAAHCSGGMDAARARIPMVMFCLAFAVLFLGRVNSPAATPRGQGVSGQNRQLFDDAVLRADKTNGADPAAITVDEKAKPGRQESPADGGRVIHIFNAVIGVVLAAVTVLCLVYLVRRKK